MSESAAYKKTVGGRLVLKTGQKVQKSIDKKKKRKRKKKALETSLDGDEVINSDGKTTTTTKKKEQLSASVILNQTEAVDARARQKSDRYCK